MAGDEELMVAYQRGDEAAFRELFARFAPLLLRIARRQLRRPAEAEDVVQQTFLQLHRARFDFDPGMKLRPWVITIAMNLARDVLRRRARWGEHVLDEANLVSPEPEESPAERAETSARVRAALAELPAAQREVIELHWFEDMSFEDIAATVGAKPGAVRVRAHRGYQLLRKSLGELVPVEPG